MSSTEPTDGSEDDLLACLGRASAVVREASAAVAWQRPDATVLDAVRRVTALRSQVEALYLDVVREVDQRGVATVSPVATTVEGFLRTTALVGAGQARRDVAAARATAPDRPLRPFAEAMSDGQGSRAHLDVAVRCLDRVPLHLLEDARAARTTVDFLELAARDASPLDMDRSTQQLLARLDPTAPSGSTRSPTSAASSTSTPTAPAWWWAGSSSTPPPALPCEQPSTTSRPRRRAGTGIGTRASPGNDAPTPSRLSSTARSGWRPPGGGSGLASWCT